MAKTGDRDTKPEKSGSRDNRLAEALRENLRRRKAQARDRGAAARTEPAGDAPAVKGGGNG